jgi:glycosyltransferase involved in cell wall biosynthesis
MRSINERPRVVILVKSGLAHSAHVRRTATSLGHAGHEVFVVGGVRDEGEPFDWRQEDGYSARVVRVPRLPRSGRDAKARREREDPLNLSRYEAAWWPIVEELRPDVVHSFDVSGLGVGLKAKHQLGARFLYEAHEPKYHVAETEREADARREANRYAAEADALVAVTGPLAEVLARDLSLDSAPPVVHCAPASASGERPPVPLREAAGVGQDTPLLVFAGLLAKKRRPDVVLEAMTTLPAVEFALAVREDEQSDELLARAQELGVAGRVHIVPKVPPNAVVSYIGGADVGVIPGECTAGKQLVLPNKLFEYLQAGLRMVVTDCAAQADFVRRHGLGESAPMEDPHAWAQAIERALAAPPYRDDADRWETLKREWSWERQEETLLGVYRELVGQSR